MPPPPNIVGKKAELDRLRPLAPRSLAVLGSRASFPSPAEVPALMGDLKRRQVAGEDVPLRELMWWRLEPSLTAYIDHLSRGATIPAGDPAPGRQDGLG